VEGELTLTPLRKPLPTGEAKGAGYSINRKKAEACMIKNISQKEKAGEGPELKRTNKESQSTKHNK